MVTIGVTLSHTAQSHKTLPARHSAPCRSLYRHVSCRYTLDLLRSTKYDCHGVLYQLLQNTAQGSHSIPRNVGLLLLPHTEIVCVSYCTCLIIIFRFTFRSASLLINLMRCTYRLPKLSGRESLVAVSNLSPTLHVRNALHTPHHKTTHLLFSSLLGFSALRLSAVSAL